jgi:hypothetical protein
MLQVGNHGGLFGCGAAISASTVYRLCDADPMVWNNLLSTFVTRNDGGVCDYWGLPVLDLYRAGPLCTSAELSFHPADVSMRFLVGLNAVGLRIRNGIVSMCACIQDEATAVWARVVATFERHVYVGTLPKSKRTMSAVPSTGKVVVHLVENANLLEFKAVVAAAHLSKKRVLKGLRDDGVSTRFQVLNDVGDEANSDRFRTHTHAHPHMTRAQGLQCSCSAMCSHWHDAPLLMTCTRLPTR